MSQALRWGLGLVVAATLVAISLVWWLLRPAAPTVPVMEANDLLKRVEAAWPRPSEGDLTGPFQQVSVVAQGQVLAHRGDPLGDDRAGLRAGASALAVHHDGQRVGTIYVVTRAQHDQAEQQRRTAWLLTSVLVGLALAVAAIWWWLDVRMLRPFRRLEHFATAVAEGDLDTVLHRDRHNPFGAFSQAFDMMRAQLSESREREATTAASKRDLVSQLSHDIRTPVASIGATAELLALTEADPGRSAKLAAILTKTHQIESLVGDLFEANTDEVATMKVDVAEITSDEVGRLLRQADSADHIGDLTLPACLVVADPARLQQVVDNIVANSYKYAGTPIEVSGVLADERLVVRIRDRGPGLPEHELDTVLGKGQRGANAGDRPGLGLGLFTASQLMERMGGTLRLQLAEPGLAVEIDLLLA